MAFSVGRYCRSRSVSFTGDLWRGPAAELSARVRAPAFEPLYGWGDRGGRWKFLCGQRSFFKCACELISIDLWDTVKRPYLWRDILLQPGAGERRQKEIRTFSAVIGSGMDRTGDAVKGKLGGSYTIEAAFVMAIVLWALLFAVQAAYRLRDEVVGSMALTETVERLRHSETEQPEEADLWALRRAGRPFSWKQYEFKVHMSGNAITGRKVKATGAGGNWKLDLEHGVFDPENFLRLLTLINQEE